MTEIRTEETPCEVISCESDIIFFAEPSAIIRPLSINTALSADADFIVLYAKPKKYPFIYTRMKGKEKIL